ncbi:MAG: plastocyanin/azurin family copper-binding protein [Gemmatimonadaceae bacterium]
MTVAQRRTIAAVATIALVGCGGGEKPKAETSAAAPPSGAVTPAPAAVTPGAPQPITGKTWDVKMYGDATGSRYDPANLTIKSGDGVRFTLVNGAPHNVAFWSDSIPPSGVAVLSGNMPMPMAPLTGPLMMNTSQTYTISFGGVPAGVYKFYCVPHLALGMKGVITVQ